LIKTGLSGNTPEKGKMKLSKRDNTLRAKFNRLIFFAKRVDYKGILFAIKRAFDFLLGSFTLVVLGGVALTAVVEKGITPAVSDFLKTLDETEVRQASVFSTFLLGFALLYTLKPLLRPVKVIRKTWMRTSVVTMLGITLFIFSAIGLNLFFSNRIGIWINSQSSPTPIASPTSFPTQTPTLTPTPTVSQTPTLTPSEIYIGIASVFMSKLNDRNFGEMETLMTSRLQQWMNEDERWNSFKLFWSMREQILVNSFYDGDGQTDSIWIEFSTNQQTDQGIVIEQWYGKFVFVYLNAIGEWRINQFEFGISSNDT
jgi:hypothetical protein